MRARLLATSGTIALILLLTQGVMANAADITVLSSALSRRAISELGPLFERDTEHEVKLQFALNPILKKRIEEGAKFDVVIIEPDMLDDLIKQGKVVVGTRVDLARVGMALIARAPAPKLNMSTVDAFKHVLLNAGAIGYFGDGHSGTVFLRTLERVGLSEKLKPKLTPLIGRSCTQAIMSGDIEMCALPVTTPSKGVEMIGRFPEEVQTYVVVSAALSAEAKALEAAKSFISFLGSPQATSVFTAQGYQQIPSR